MAKEPVLFLVIGGMGLVQALVHTLRAFGVPITEPEEAAIYSLWAVVLGILARMCVVPVSALPAGTVEKIAAEKLANANP